MAYKSFHTLNNSRSGSKGYVGFKLDMAKVYDGIEWRFIENTLKAKGFPNKITSIIMNSVETITLSISINGNYSKWFKPSRVII